MMLITPGVPLLGSFSLHRRVRRPGLRLHLRRLLHQPHPDRRLPRRRSARGQLRDRAGHGSCWLTKSASDPDEIRAATTWQAADIRELETARTLVVRLRQLQPEPRSPPSSSSDYAACGPSSSAAGRGEPSSSASVCVPTSRSVVWLPVRALGGLNYGAGGWEHATVRFLPTGKVEVVSGSTPHGQGHETAGRMIVADKLGVDPDDVDGPALRHRDQSPRAGHLRVRRSRPLAASPSRWPATR